MGPQSPPCTLTCAQDPGLALSRELLNGNVWSSRLQEHRPLADSLLG
ncbi:MAG: hypothetical protein VKM34_04345 [Cyanobacteriota bacterium]|nr:hypothetical protein [Cyanobacteriota bacterium]